MWTNAQATRVLMVVPARTRWILLFLLLHMTHMYAHAGVGGATQQATKIARLTMTSAQAILARTARHARTCQITFMCAHVATDMLGKTASMISMSVEAIRV